MSISRAESSPGASLLGAADAISDTLVVTPNVSSTRPKNAATSCSSLTLPSVRSSVSSALQSGPSSQKLRIAPIEAARRAASRIALQRGLAFAIELQSERAQDVKLDQPAASQAAL